MPLTGQPNTTLGAPVVSSDGFLTAYSDPSTASVILQPDFHTLPSYVGLVTVYRRDPDGTVSVVRGLDAYPSPMCVTRSIDHEAPLGVSCAYWAQATDDNGTVVATSTEVAIGTPAAYGHTWLKSLRAPGRSVKLWTQTYPDWLEDIPQGVFYPDLGSSPVVVSGQRRLGTGTWALLGLTAAETAAVRTLTRSEGGGPYLLQPSAESGEDDVYVTLPGVTAARVTRIAADPARSYSLTVTQINRPPTAGARVALPGHTVAELAARYPSQAAYPSPQLAQMTS